MAARDDHERGAGVSDGGHDPHAGDGGSAPPEPTAEGERAGSRGPRMLWGRIEAPETWTPGEPQTPPATHPPLAPTSALDGRAPDWARATQETAGGDGRPTVPEQPVRTPEILLATVAGVLAALVAGLVWGLVARATGNELQVVAVGVGFVAGLAVAMVGRRGSPFTTIAVVATAIGILVGKYLSFAFVFREQIGFEVGRPVGALSGDMLDAFRDRIGDVFSIFDAVWLGIAIVAALLVTGASSQQAADGAPARKHHHPMDRFTGGLPSALRVTIDWAVTIAGAVGIVLLVKAYVVNPYRIPSSSMEPTLHCAFGESGCAARFSDRVLANRFIYHFRDPRRGEIIVFETPPAAQNRCGAGGTFVKRLVGLPGEKIEIRLVDGDGYVFINGHKLDEPYVEEDRRQLTQGYGPTTIPKDHYFMMGDNREASCDSRDWGTVPRKNLIGNVFATYWPPQRISFH